MQEAIGLLDGRMVGRRLLVVGRSSNCFCPCRNVNNGPPRYMLQQAITRLSFLPFPRLLTDVLWVYYRWFPRGASAGMKSGRVSPCLNPIKSVNRETVSLYKSPLWFPLISPRHRLHFWLRCSRNFADAIIISVPTFGRPETTLQSNQIGAQLSNFDPGIRSTLRFLLRFRRGGTQKESDKLREARRARIQCKNSEVLM